MPPDVHSRPNAFGTSRETWQPKGEARGGNRAAEGHLKVTENDVRVVWSNDGKKCGVLIWGKMRGIIDIGEGIEGQAFIETRDSPPIRDPEWLRGFE